MLVVVIALMGDVFSQSPEHHLLASRSIRRISETALGGVVFPRISPLKVVPVQSRLNAAIVEITLNVMKGRHSHFWVAKGYHFYGLRASR